MSSIPLNQTELRKLIKEFLKEDLGSGDITTNSIVPVGARALGRLIAKEECVLAGVELAGKVFKVLDPSVRLTSIYRDGQRVPAGRTIAIARGRAHALLAGERVALNLLQRLSGIATLTHAFVQAVRGTQAKILDTRKTTPGWRLLEKYAVRCGGGKNHRLGLYDAILIKDNHIAMAGGLREAVLRARGGDQGRGPVTHRRREQTRVSGLREKVTVVASMNSFLIHRGFSLDRSQKPPVRNPLRRITGVTRASNAFFPIEVEVTNLNQLREVLDLRVDRVLFDNMSPAQVRCCVKFIRRQPGGNRVTVECSGGITLKTARAFALAGADWISVGALTHSAKAVDVSFEISGE